MTSEMRNLRKEDLSLYYYLKHVVLANFIEKEEDVPLRYMPEIPNSYVYEAVSEMIPSPTERGRGWVYLDTIPGTNEPVVVTIDKKTYYIEQTERVTVVDSSKIVVDELGNIIIDENGDIVVLEGYAISDSEYMIDYIDGRIVVSGTCKPTHVTYDWYTVSLVDEWSVVEAADPPVVVIDIHGTDKIGYQLGGGKLATRKVDLHVFASDTAERNDIVEALYDGLYLRSCPVYSFPEGTILDYDGTWYGRRENMDKTETLFNRTTVSGIIGNLMFENVTSRHVSLPLLMTRGRTEIMLSDLNAYRSKVSFDMYHYTES